MHIIEIISLTLELVGTLFIAFAALRVHHRFLAEHRVDKKVLHAMRRERLIGITGVVFVLGGYVLNLAVIVHNYY